ncbi:hypothetical protein ACFQ9X_14180 [Catenulispora yoronensis]
MDWAKVAAKLGVTEQQLQNALRDTKVWIGQTGVEPTPEVFIKHLAALLHKPEALVKDALGPTGILDPGGSKPGDPKGGSPKPGDPKPGDPKPGDPKGGGPKPGDPKGGDPKPGDPKGGDPKPGDPQGGGTVKTPPAAPGK